MYLLWTILLRNGQKPATAQRSLRSRRRWNTSWSGPGARGTDDEFILLNGLICGDCREHLQDFLEHREDLSKLYLQYGKFWRKAGLDHTLAMQRFGFHYLRAIMLQSQFWDQWKGTMKCWNAICGWFSTFPHDKAGYDREKDRRRNNQKFAKMNGSASWMMLNVDYRFCSAMSASTDAKLPQ